MRSVYIAGPYTADTEQEIDENISRAASVAADYIRQGWAVFCPHTMTSLIDRKFNADGKITYENWLTIDFYWLSKCDAVHFLPGWEHSNGAKLEHMVAESLGKAIILGG